MLLWVETDGLRNLAPGRIALDAELVLVTGDNAQGKSSLLEAAYLLATTRSFRTAQTREAIRHGAELTTVRGGVRSGVQTETCLSLGIGKARGARRLAVGEYEVGITEYLGWLPALALTGDSIRKVAGSPAERRRFMDRGAAAADPRHLADTADYRRALAQRNALLRQGAPDALLAPWDEVTARAGEAIEARRRVHLASWQHEIGAWPVLFPEGAKARLAYRQGGVRTALKGEKIPLLDRLAAGRNEERRQGMTLVGPHRDDLAVEFDGTDLLRFGSAGQVRAALSALTLAQARSVAAARGGARPLLVLDDADTDLDPARCDAHLQAARAEGQTLAATSKPRQGWSADRVLRVAGGQVSE